MGTDLSARSDRALDRAVALARNSGGDLTIVHVVDEDFPPLVTDAHQEQAERTIRQHVDSLTADGGPNTSIRVVSGRTYVKILEISESIDADIIVVGMHREDAFKDMFRGTTAERVIRAGNTPVLLVKDRASGPYQRVMVGVDFSVYASHAVEFAASLLPSAEFHLVHAYNIPYNSFLRGSITREKFLNLQRQRFHKLTEKEMETFLANITIEIENIEEILEEGSILEVIHKQKNLLNSDLLVIGTHGRTGFERVFLGSIAEELLRNPPCDVLAVKAW